MALELLPQFSSYRVPDDDTVIQTAGKYIPPTVGPPQIEYFFTMASQEPVLAPVFLCLCRGKTNGFDLFLSKHDFGVIRCCGNIQTIFGKPDAIYCLEMSGSELGLKSKDFWQSLGLLVPLFAQTPKHREVDNP